jgi:hypothetical protein
MTYNPISQAEVLRQIKAATNFLLDNHDTLHIAIPMHINKSKYKNTLYSCNDQFIKPVEKYLHDLERIKRNLVITLGNYTVMTDNYKTIPNSLVPTIILFLRACEILIMTNNFNDTMLHNINTIVSAIVNFVLEKDDVRLSIDLQTLCLIIRTVDMLETNKINNNTKMQFIESLLDKN